MAREKAGQLLRDLNDLGVAERGGIVLTTPTGDAVRRGAPPRAPRARRPGRRGRSGSGRGARPTPRAGRRCPSTSSSCLPTILAAIAVITDSSVLVVGAMVVGPEFSAVAALCAGLVFAPVGAGLGAACGCWCFGFAFAIAVVALLASAWSLTGAITAEMVTRPRPQTGFIWHPDMLVVRGRAGRRCRGRAGAGDREDQRHGRGLHLASPRCPAAGNMALGLAHVAGLEIVGSRRPSSASTCSAWCWPGRSCWRSSGPLWHRVMARTERLFGQRGRGVRRSLSTAQVAAGVVGAEAEPLVERQRRVVVGLDVQPGRGRAPLGAPLQQRREHRACPARGGGGRGRPRCAWKPSQSPSVRRDAAGEPSPISTRPAAAALARAVTRPSARRCPRPAAVSQLREGAATRPAGSAASPPSAPSRGRGKRVLDAGAGLDLGHRPGGRARRRTPGPGCSPRRTAGPARPNARHGVRPPARGPRSPGRTAAASHRAARSPGPATAPTRATGPRAARPGAAPRGGAARACRTRCRRGGSRPGRPARVATTQRPSPHAVHTPSTSVIAGPPEGPVSPGRTRRTTTRRPTTWGPERCGPGGGSARRDTRLSILG